MLPSRRFPRWFLHLILLLSRRWSGRVPPAGGTRPLHLRASRSPLPQQATHRLRQQLFEVALDRPPQLAWIDRRPQFLQPSALLLAQHSCRQYALERRLSAIPAPDGTPVGVGFLTQAQHWLKQVTLIAS